VSVTKHAETCRCGGSITVEGDGFDMSIVLDWRSTHKDCLRSPHFTDRSGSTSASMVFGFSRNFDTRPTVR